uniref:Ovule protein n=1 Tax=Schistosoma mansoni TaxID=6183 RepID=A0A5K4F4R0_SCHMA
MYDEQTHNHNHHTLKQKVSHSDPQNHPVYWHYSTHVSTSRNNQTTFRSHFKERKKTVHLRVALSLMLGIKGSFKYVVFVRCEHGFNCDDV